MSKTVLVVDDQLGIRFLLEEVIKQEGFHVEAAANGKEALDMIVANPPDLIFLDFKLPVIDGPKVVEKLEQQNIHIPTIVISGLPEIAEEKMQHFASVVQTIGKPFQLNDIREIVNNLLD
ncbi:hypothetical protein JCM21714_1539 [Gracilibacillus boraciitolerans JCM 21714]|uniref:Response regulatory domain-containing protein n=1 Tax=Gracilibacillus boraciitolerans JCM 21714 TaxID=1298598 RepID=W4VI87_9BACI|nr:response regulator [Gracilibacillus boraciitolerans]GAE92533.1 hypothetical protein JCM21714_1539 [Gracilibacillus boraciitolerans JCM 21714]